MHRRTGTCTVAGRRGLVRAGAPGGRRRRRADSNLHILGDSESDPKHAPVTLDARHIETLSASSTATLPTVLMKKGLRDVWMRGSRPLRFVPAREDLATPESLASPKSTRAAIEAMPGLYPPDAENEARYEAQRRR